MDDLMTVAALGALAFVATDLAHEVIGAWDWISPGGRASRHPNDDPTHR